MDTPSNELRPYNATAGDVAKHFGVSRSTVYNWLDGGDPPPHRRVGNLIRFNLPEVDEWAKGRAA